MGAKSQLRDLQLRQRHHDEKHHRDIFYLPYPQRIRHLVLHLAKYTGRLAGSAVASDLTQLKRTLVDTFIVALSASEMLQIDLAAAVLSGEAEKASTLADAGALLGKRGKPKKLGIGERLFRQLAQITGRMAKACESLDHMEAFDYRETLRTGVVEVIRLTLVVAHAVQVNLDRSVRARWAAIERQAIL